MTLREMTLLEQSHPQHSRWMTYMTQSFVHYCVTMGFFDQVGTVQPLTGGLKLTHVTARAEFRMVMVQTPSTAL